MQKQNSIDSSTYQTKCISLRSCYVFRRSPSAIDTLVSTTNLAPLLTNGTNGSVLDIILPQDQTCYSIRFTDDMYARKWFYIIHSKISRCLLESLPDIEEYFYIIRNTNEVKALGWVAEQVNQNEIRTWQPVFMVLTESEVCFLSNVPLSKQTYREPDVIYSILSSR